MKILILANEFPFMVLPTLLAFTLLGVLNIVFLLKYMKCKKTGFLFKSQKLLLLILCILSVILITFIAGIIWYGIQNMCGLLWIIGAVLTMLIELLLIPSTGIYFWLSLLSTYLYRKNIMD